MTKTSNYKHMNVNILLGIIFISLILIASENNINDPELINCTELNGSGCVCHSLERDLNVDVWVEGPESLYVGQMGIYRMYLAGGPAEAGGYNVAGRFGTMELVDTFSFRNPLALNELTQAFSLPFPTPEDTIYWEFGYVVSDAVDVDTIYSCGLSLVWDLIPDSLDRWNFGYKFPVTIMNVIPVELSSFTATTEGQNALLNWRTATELNNRGFEIQRIPLSNSRIKGGKQGGWQVIGFIDGVGTTTEPQHYSFTDTELSNGVYRYRLKQVDLDGSFIFSEQVEISINVPPAEFKLSQNYPNPFNPSTTIRFSIPEAENVVLKIYDIIGNETVTLTDERLSAGNYNINFNASDLSSGIYFYSLDAGSFGATKKMILLK